MHANNLVVNDSTTRETVKGVAESLPKLDTETAAAFVIKTIYAVDPSALVIST